MIESNNTYPWGHSDPNDPDMFYGTWWNYKSDLNISNENFLTYEDKFAPQDYAGDNYTALIRWKLSDPLQTTDPNYGIGIDITGYGSRGGENLPPQVFEPENVILLCNGACHSTCTIFSEFARTQGGLKSVVLGGRPSSDPIQAIGGIKGAQDIDLIGPTSNTMWPRQLSTQPLQRSRPHSSHTLTTQPCLIDRTRLV